MIKNIKVKVCIVGSGFCGYVAYKKLKEKRVKVLLLEGGTPHNPKNVNEQKNYKVKVNEYAGKPKSGKKERKVKTFIDPSWFQRRYTLGGSSEAWSGWIKPFEDSSYSNIYQTNTNRDWSGNKFRKYEKEALRLLNSPILEFDPYKLSRDFNIELPKLNKGLYYTAYSWAPKPLRLKDFWLKRSVDSPEKISSDKDVLYGYRLESLETKNKKIFSGEFYSLNGDHLSVEADNFILCLGAIENAKILQKLYRQENISNPNNEIGNFQEHPHIYRSAFFNKGLKQIPKILTDKLEIKDKKNDQSRGSIKLMICAWDGPGTPKVSFSISKLKDANPLIRMRRNFVNRLINSPDIYKVINTDYTLHMRCEQTPNTLSRLNFDKDFTSLNWKVKDSDFIYYSDYLKRFSSFLISSGLTDKVILHDKALNGYAFPNKLKGGAHHMGTVPLLKDESILDSNLTHKLFENISIVGSSCFPTSGFENPTHGAILSTFVAVDHIIKKLNTI
tara:strand:- start:1559 stop:3061 length:1503 start_codon:yes stop_codon:yes gene_type:complete